MVLLKLFGNQNQRAARNKGLAVDLKEMEIAVEKRESDQLKNALRGRAAKALATLTERASDEFDAMASVDMRNTMVVVVFENAGDDGTTVSQLQALTFGGLVRRIEAAVSAKDGAAASSCNDGEQNSRHASGMRGLLQEMREEGGENFEEVAHMCGADVRNSLIVELWSRTHVEVAGLQALDDEQLLKRGKELLRKGVLPRSK